MLPSTGYFKGISCPFYESGLCERPYCHFRHAKKETLAAADSGAILQQLVSEAVKKVLSQTDQGALETPVPAASAALDPSHVPAPGKLIYNPTPIAELNKFNSSTDDGSLSSEDRPRRHIPVPYTPHRPATVPAQHFNIDDNGASKPFIYNPPENVTYAPGSGDAKQPDPYKPEGTTVSNGKYLPGSETELQAYTPSDTKLTSSSNKLNYVPTGSTGKLEKKKKIIEYEPTRASVNAGMSRYSKSKDDSKKDLVNEVVLSGVIYRPTPLSKVPCFSSDEEEPNVKKRKVSKEGTDLNGLDDLDTEFELLGQILDEEKSENSATHKSCSHKENTKGNNKKESCKEKFKSSEKSLGGTNKLSNREDKSSSRDKDKRDIDKVKTSSSSKLKGSSSESHKSSHKGKDREKHRHKSKDSNKKKEHHSSSRKSSSQSDRQTSDKSTAITTTSKHSNQHKQINKDNREKHDGQKNYKISKKENRSSRQNTKKSSKDKSPKHANDVSNEILSDDSNLDHLIEEISDPDDDTIAMECMKIFDEYVPEIKQARPGETETRVEAHEEYVPTKKRISHTSDKNIKVFTRPPPKPDHRVNAAQAMAQRLAKIREFHALKNISTNSVMPEISTPLNIEVPGNIAPSHSKVRIAHVPNVSLLLNAKKPITTTTPIDITQPSTSSTIMHTIKKGTSRMAHVPNEKFADRPGVLEPLASKIPANLRSTYLNMMIDECLKIYIIPTDAYARAQQEELATSKKCTTVAIYKNSAVLAISRLRKELQECGGVKKCSYEDDPTKISHSQLLIGKLAQSSWSIERSKKANDFSNEFKGLTFYKNISGWVLEEEQLQQNGFPRPHPDGEKGRAKIYVENHKQIPPKGRLRTCCRCKREYMVDKRGLPASKEDCIYHPNKKYRQRGETRYQCCNQDGNSEGCAMATSHVFEYVDYDNLRGFVKTMPKDVADADNYDFGIYALDCEMCYTTQGLDLTRITVINTECKTVYETLVKPFHPIVDYNTRYSGITEEQMSEVTTTLLEVQATLLSMFNSRTILIGHSLESDFKALKLIHDTIIDTSVLFPHKMGPPYKRALRNLTSEHLKKIIQNSTEGHDSAEDATVCMELVQFKLKEELKLR